jgi:hypothetical protein
MLVKSCVIDIDVMHICVFLGDQHWLETQFNVLISMMNPTSSRIWSSAAIVLHIGSSNHQRGCFTGLAFGSTLSACSASSLGTPSMFAWHQANISQCSWRNSTSALSYVDVRSEATEVVLFGFTGWTRTFFASRVESKAWSGRDHPMSGRILWSVSPLSRAYSIVMPKVCAILWNSFL